MRDKSGDGGVTQWNSPCLPEALGFIPVTPPTHEKQKKSEKNKII
jgi:hypothetical protein